MGDMHGCITAIQGKSTGTIYHRLHMDSSNNKKFLKLESAREYNTHG